MIPSVFLPSVLFSVGIGAITPMIAVSAVSLGAGGALAALLVSMVPIGQIVGDIPAGALASKLGDRSAMALSSLIAMAAMTVCAAAPSLLVLGIGVFIIGIANAAYGLARQAYLTDVVPAMWRARAMSALGGSSRIGLFIGPFLGAALVHGSQAIAPSYWLGVGTSLIAGIVVWIFVPRQRDSEAGEALAAPATAPTRNESGEKESGSGETGAAAAGAASKAEAKPSAPSTWQIVRDYRAIFLTLGTAILLVGAVRGARQAVLPLWTEHLGFAPATTSIVFGLAGAVDMMLFYPAGKVMDRFGRLWIAIPSMATMALALALLPLAHSLVFVIVIAFVLGIGNGMGSGIMMTLGADTAPVQGRAKYLGVFRIFGDAGNALGPLVISLGALIGSLGAGIAAMAAVGVAATAALGRWVPRWTHHANARTRRQAGIIK